MKFGKAIFLFISHLKQQFKEMNRSTTYMLCSKYMTDNTGFSQHLYGSQPSCEEKVGTDYGSGRKLA